MLEVTVDILPLVKTVGWEHFNQQAAYLIRKGLEQEGFLRLTENSIVIETIKVEEINYGET